MITWTILFIAVFVLTKRPFISLRMEIEFFPSMAFFTIKKLRTLPLIRRSNFAFKIPFFTLLGFYFPWVSSKILRVMSVDTRLSIMAIYLELKKLQDNFKEFIII